MQRYILFVKKIESKKFVLIQNAIINNSEDTFIHGV